uniref:NADH-ubiquinone oxidoreductase chain 2 n=1 Tax=Nezara viridula TaxID=85310 RepID=B7S636_NEZVI|nr:NADH dehydrogenase subunit 2 [Nezara viridula]ABM63305.1 NADH dehydrogenase subunit 2 [Nezara viridula]
MKKSNWLFYFLLIMSTLITISANNWMSMWMGLELNMMSFIPLILQKNSKSSSEAAMIYFLIQSISSIILFMMITINLLKLLNYSNMINMLITISILMKLGAAPFHKWMPEIMTKMSGMKCMILMTWQKMAPLMMICNLNSNMMLIKLSIIWSVGVGSIGGINQSSLRKLMAYSSINHLGWMLAINKKINLWLMYWMIYSMIIFMICLMFNNYKLLFLNQISSSNMNNPEKISMFIMMLSMGGLPPFIGFLPKWITIQTMINSKEFMTLFFMIMFSLVTLMFYMRVMTNMYLSFNSSIKWVTINQSKMMTMMIMLINFSLPLIIIMDIF